MAKSIARYICSECGYISITKTGRCPECGAWGTMEREQENPTFNLSGKKASGENLNLAPARVVSAVKVKAPKRIKTGIEEFDRVLGGGLVPGGVVLLGGQPGIGKSTLLLQAACQVAASGRKVLYISGEESEAQVALRAFRLAGANPNDENGTSDKNATMISEKLLLCCGSELEPALANLNINNNSDDDDKIAFLVLDSVQAMRSVGSDSSDRLPGSVSQVRAVASCIVDVAREKNIPAVLIGHITKDGKIAGPMLLEHMVDTVLSFTGEGYSIYRMLRAVKNRYGSTEELGIFEMRETGLVPVRDKSGLYWNRADTAVPGVAMTIALEGTTPLAAELQTLAAPTVFPYPRRTSRGIELNRFQLLAAVVERRCGIVTIAHDLYSNVAGGLSIQDPSADLAICASLASALRDTPLKSGACWLGEVGLAGEIRPVSRIEMRLKEAARLGFTSAIISSHERKLDARDLEGLELERVSHIDEALAGLILGTRRKGA